MTEKGMAGLLRLHYLVRRACDLLRATWFTGVAHVKFRLWNVHVGSGLRVTGPIRLNIHPTALCRIGRDCTIHSSYRANPVGAGQVPVLYVSRHARLVIGNGVGLSHATIVCAEAVTIEDQVLIGGGAFISDTDSHALLASQRLAHEAAKTRPIHIGRRSFIGGYTILLKGTSIGEEAVIGAGTTVAGAVPAREIWAGNPARFIGRINENAASIQNP